MSKLLNWWREIKWGEVKISLCEWTLKTGDFIWNVCQLAGSFLFLVGLGVFIFTGNFYLLLLSASLIVGASAIEITMINVLHLKERLDQLKKEEWGVVED